MEFDVTTLDLLPAAESGLGRCTLETCDNTCLTTCKWTDGG